MPIGSYSKGAGASAEASYEKVLRLNISAMVSVVKEKGNREHLDRADGGPFMPVEGSKTKLQ